jgi:alpha-methylacyl-CoA racemase
VRSSARQLADQLFAFHARHRRVGQPARARNFFIHTAPFYQVFECADGKHVTLGVIEP